MSEQGSSVEVVDGRPAHAASAARVADLGCRDVRLADRMTVLD